MFRPGIWIGVIGSLLGVTAALDVLPEGLTQADVLTVVLPITGIGRAVFRKPGHPFDQDWPRHGFNYHPDYAAKSISIRSISRANSKRSWSRSSSGSLLAIC